MALLCGFCHFPCRGSCPRARAARRRIDATAASVSGAKTDFLQELAERVRGAEPVTPPGRNWGCIWVPPPGCAVWEAVEAVLAQIRGTDRAARLQFNGTEVELRPGDTVDEGVERWRSDRAAYQARLGIKPW